MMEMSIILLFFSHKCVFVRFFGLREMKINAGGKIGHDEYYL